MAHAKCLTKMRLMKGLFREVWLVLKEPRRDAGHPAEEQQGQLLPRIGIKRPGGRGLRGTVQLDRWPQTPKTTARHRSWGVREVAYIKPLFLFHVSVPPIGPNQPEAGGQSALCDRGHAPGTEQGNGG